MCYWNDLGEGKEKDPRCKCQVEAVERLHVRGSTTGTRKAAV
jgi:hypothetical protein